MTRKQTRVAIAEKILTDTKGQDPLDILSALATAAATTIHTQTGGNLIAGLRICDAYLSDLKNALNQHELLKSLGGKANA
jgi:hypothetical protein